MTDLCEESLIAVIKEYMKSHEACIKITPTKMWIPKYDDETQAEYEARFARAWETVRLLK